MRSLVTSIFLYACESRTLTAELQRRIQAMEIRCYRKILHISYKRPCYQRGSPCQDPAGNCTARRPPEGRKETQTAVVWSCLPFIRFGQSHLARHSERGKKTKQTEEEVRRQNQGMDRPGVRQVPESSGEQCKMEKTGCKIICGAPKTIAVKELMMMMMRAEGCTMIRPHRIELECWLVDIIIIIISIIINPLTARVVGTLQMILQAVFSIFPCSPDVVFPPLPLSALSSSPFHCALQDGFGQT